MHHADSGGGMHASVRYFFCVGGPPSLSQAAMIRYLLRMYRLLARRRISHTRAVPITMRSMETGDRARTAVIPFRFNMSTTSSRPPSLFRCHSFTPGPNVCRPRPLPFSAPFELSWIMTGARSFVPYCVCSVLWCCLRIIP